MNTTIHTLTEYQIKTLLSEAAAARDGDITRACRTMLIALRSEPSVYDASLSSDAAAASAKMIVKAINNAEAQALCCDGECHGIRSRCEVWGEQDSEDS